MAAAGLPLHRPTEAFCQLNGSHLRGSASTTSSVAAVINVAAQFDPRKPVAAGGSGAGVCSCTSGARAEAPSATDEDSAAHELAALLRGLVDAGWERLRCVSVLSLLPRRSLPFNRVVRDLAAMRAAGMEVLDLVGILDGAGKVSQANADAASSVGPAAQRDEGEDVESRGRGASGALEKLERRLQRELRSAAESAGGDAALSEMLQRVVSRLPSSHPGLQVLVLPAVVPRAGRAVRKAPTRSGGARTTAPRLLQLLVPLLSELRLAVTARRRPGDGGCPGGLPRLQAAVMVLGPEAEAHEAVLRQLAASTLDRCTGVGAEVAVGQEAQDQ